jgi:PAS domain S-box-containing protein
MSGQAGRLPDEKKYREQIVRELAQIRALLASKDRLCRQQAQELADAKSMLDALRAYEEKYRMVIAHMKDTFFFQDKALRYIWVLNPADPLAEQEVVGRTDADLLPPDEAERLTQIKRAVMHSGQGTSMELQLSPGGIKRWFEAVYEPYRDDEGRIKGIASQSRDITKRKQAQAALLESEERYRSLFHNNHAVMLLIELPGGKIAEANPAACAYYGYSPDTITKLNIADINILPAEQVRTEMQRARSEQRRHFNFKHRLADGAIREVEVFSGPISVRGRKMLFSIVHDITEAKQAEAALRISEEAFRTMANAMPQLVWTANPDGRVDYYNDRYKEYPGIERMPDGTFRWGPVLHEHDHAQTVEAWHRAVQTGAIYQIEHRVKRPDGTFRWHLSRAAPVRDKGGAILKWFGTATDIHDLKKAENALKQLNENLEQRVSERTELAEARARQLQALAVELIEAEERERRRIAVLLHDDLQQLLASARMQLQAASANRSAEALLTVEGVLEEAIRKSRSLSHELSPAVLHHSGLLAGLKWLVGQVEEQFGLRVSMRADAFPQFNNAPLEVFIFRAVQELLFNLVKHAGVKSGRVDLCGTNGVLEISVSDQGKGFDLSRLDPSNGKIGIGLMTIRERASHIGGSLTVESAPGHGSRFTLTVPIASDFGTKHQVVPEPDGLPSKGATAAMTAQGGGIRVLFVDDHKVMRKGLIQLIANQADIQVAGEAADGREAIEKARQLLPDVLVMDVSMPLMDGIEATRRIKAEMPHIRIIGLSMFEDEHVSVAMRMAGAEAFISKTASTTELLKAICGPRTNA